MITSEDFIKRAKRVHGDTYDYSLIDCKGYNKKVKIICKKHGIFEQSGKHHFYGAGCNKCGIERAASKMRGTLEDFVKLAKLKYENKYDYKLVNYVNQQTKVKIICPEHGEFEQTPRNHLSNKYGCKKCAGFLILTTKDFIDEAIKIHGGLYDYTESIYNKIDEKVAVTCKKHGKFYITACSHIHNKHGCKKCADDGRILSFKEFLKRARSIHGDKYDYSLSKYKGIYDKMKIVCKEHGVFYKTPANHIYAKAGCLKCSTRRSIDTESFIEYSKEVHGDKYDYSKTEYNKKSPIVSIICPQHGAFKQNVFSHLNGHGCASCAGVKKLTTDEFIEKAKEVHGNLYDYSKSFYKGATIDIKIICRIHGIFEQKPVDHTRLKHGCPRCSNTYNYDTSEFISKAKRKHGDDYTYKNCVYIANSKPVIITCKKHGDFNQRANDHLNGAGCPICNSSKGENIIRKFLSSLSIKFEEQKKFKECKNKKSLPFDFYLQDHNLLIEYDGKQHFTPIDEWGGETSFKNTIKNDKIKNNWCLDNGITLLRIPYTSFNKIKQILERYLKKYEPK